MLHCPRTFARTIAFSGLFLATVLTPALAADPTGDWRDADGFANIRVAQCNGNMWGAVVWEKTPGGKDKNNPDPAKQTRPTLGMPILIDMKKKPGADAWEGQVYNAKDGQLYSATIKPVGSDQLEIQGCVLGFLCGGQTWTRVGPPIPVSTASNPPKGAAPKSAAPPKTTGSVAHGTKPGQKQAANAPGAPGDTVGDICLLPDIAHPTQ
ncbi:MULTISPECIES: DUF2147 domain-containing protein [unclassified Bradyrhizobium]|uniref:DUF2147 domain-containing protein n=1 Tax=unclassified Bradyrhizobium TaxID=2631580 RepID=UPI00247AC265|nr:MULTISPECIES: DUF2147 domain-containing protein [unclassified Bradyrhizobium]WGS18393.1 DUF2147 domain-containing protein [Bradyrhizobium sp. ISRA463]WGS25212.1 DUF2147 domain-containing protein [Bradyrhizobium sp. ISRA464]